MKPRILKIKSCAIASAKPLIQPISSRIWKNFSGARMLLPLTENKNMPSSNISTNIINNLRAVNNVAVQVTVLGSNGTASGRVQPSGIYKSVNSVAQTVIDDALKHEIDRELTLMKRGENIGSNQRRINQMRTYLNAKPYHVIRNFYAVHMNHKADSKTTQKAQEEPFYTDIIREKSVKESRSINEYHLSKKIDSPPQTNVGQNTDVKKIAGQVLEQVEKRMKLNQERRGVWF